MIDTHVTVKFWSAKKAGLLNERVKSWFLIVILRLQKLYGDMCFDW